VGNGVTERLEFFVGLGQLRGAALQIGVEPADFMFRLLALGDVQVDPHDARRLALGSGDDPLGGLDDAHGAVASAHDAELALVLAAGRDGVLQPRLLPC